MEKIVYRDGNSVAVITPARSVDEAMKDIPEGVEYKIIDESELPKDRIFRNAWGYDLKEDVAKSKEIWKEKLRVDRKPLLEAQDIAFIQALENGDDTAGIKTEKQRLRDVTNLVDDCTTITQIKKVKV